MNFKQDEIHNDLIEMYREFAQSQVKPLAAEIDKEERFPEETVQAMAEMGLFGIPFPEEYGGTGMDNLSYAQCGNRCRRPEDSCSGQRRSLAVKRFKMFYNQCRTGRYLPCFCNDG
ncbi:MAG: acyl-CoA dehydrogenase family protein [Lachnospiraceae bacterium]|nr:acyl-CoA dehydrogenase family protein [Lachnospiraceae bacterium]